MVERIDRLFKAKFILEEANLKFFLLLGSPAVLRAIILFFFAF
jgi:hypothetical protein